MPLLVLSGTLMPTVIADPLSLTTYRITQIARAAQPRARLTEHHHRLWWRTSESDWRRAGLNVSPV